VPRGGRPLYPCRASGARLHGDEAGIIGRSLGGFLALWQWRHRIQARKVRVRPVRYLHFCIQMGKQ
jgi:hypothetical protein